MRENGLCCDKGASPYPCAHGKCGYGGANEPGPSAGRGTKNHGMYSDMLLMIDN
jgi:hypothetical protein